MPEPKETSPLLRGLQNHGPSSESYATNDRDSDDIESQETAEGQFEGLPEVKQQMKYLFPALSIGVLLAAADQTIIVTIYGRIGSELNALNNTSWIATAYFLTLTSFQPLYGKLSDIFGRKPCLLSAYIIFGLGCLFSGLAKTMNQLILARGFAGIGGGGMATCGSILLSDVVPLRERGTWQGYINIVYAIGAATGAPLGGILSDSIGWRVAFIGQPPFCLLAFVMVWWTLDLPKKDNSHWKEKLRRVDFFGAVVLLCAVAAILFGMDRGSNVAWQDKYTVVSLGASVILFITFVLVEICVASEPFAPSRIIFERSLFAAYLCNLFSFAGYMGTIFFAPLYFQAVDGLSATQASVKLIPPIICSVSGSLFGGVYMQRTGRYYWITVTCYFALVIGTIDILLFSGLAVPSMSGLVLGLMICGFSNGIGVTTTLIGLIANAGPEDQAIATACSYLFRSLGSAMGVSLCATAANQALREALKDALGSSKDANRIADKVRQSLEYIRQLEPGARIVVREVRKLEVRTRIF